MITKFKIFENQKTIDQILDKINKYGIKNISDKEKEYLDKVSRGETPEDLYVFQDPLPKPRTVRGTITGELMGQFEVIDFTDSYIYGRLTIKKEEFLGWIYYNKNGYIHADFNATDASVYEVFQGLEYELDNFFQFLYYTLVEQS